MESNLYTYGVVPIVSEMIPIHTLQLYSTKIHFNIVIGCPNSIYFGSLEMQKYCRDAHYKVTSW
jgi:hypothetical protein